MADGSTTLLYRFLGIDAGAGAQFDRMAGKTAMLGDTSSRTAGLVGKLAVGASVAGAVIAVAAVKMASDFQRSMTLIQTQAGASSTEVKAFSKDILGMAGQVAQSPEDLATSLYHVYSALKKVGADGPQMLHAVRIAAEGAKVGNTDLEDTTNSLTATLASGIVRFNQASKAMGYLNAIVGAGDMKFSDLNQALGTGLLVTMRTYGVSLKDTGAALAVFGDNNIRGADAATKLRMSVQDLIKPAANADEVLRNVGLSSDQLRQSVEQHGLNATLQLLKNHLDAVGITGSKVGGFLSDAFTKKAGAGLAILLTRLHQFDEARSTEQRAAAGFGSAWAATTHTAAFAFDRLKAEAQAAMIELGTRLLPVVTKVANWLGTNLPHAISTVGDVLRPFVGVAVSLGGALKVAGTAMTAVGHALAAIGPELKTTATVVLAMWAAFKGAALVRVAMSGLGDALFMLRLRASVAKDALLGVRTASAEAGIAAEGATVGMSAMLGPVAAVAGGVAILASMFHHSDQAAQELKQTTADFLGILQQTKGAINDQVVAMVTQKLATSGVYDTARQYGASLKTVTQAALGNKDAEAALSGQVNGNKIALLKLLPTIDQLSHGLGDAQHQYQLATSQAKVNSTATHANTSAAVQAKLAAQKQADALNTLTKSLQSLINTEISQLQTEDGFKEGLLQLNKQVKDNGDSLSKNTQKGLANRDALLSILSSAEKGAEGSKNYSKALQDNIAKFITFTQNAGFSKKAVDQILTSLHLMPGQIKKAFAVKPELDLSGIKQSLTATIADASYAGNQAGHAFSNAFKAANGIASPSKVFRQYGIWIMQGLVNGMKTLTPKVASVAREIQRGFMNGWTGGTTNLLDALPEHVQHVLQRLSDVVDKAIAKQRDALNKSRSNLHSLLQQRRSDIASLAGTVSQGADLSGLFGTDAAGNPTVTNVNQFLSGQAKTIENFAKDLKWAARHHLSPALLTEIAGLGAEQGDQVLKQFMSGQASITQANRSEATIQKYARGAASTAEDALYAKRVAADRKAVHENTVELRHLTAQLHRIERVTARQISTHLTIDAKTGKPVVDKQFIDDVIKGIKRANRVAGRSLL